jgi:phosphoglucomutase/phosphomannomutase
LREEAFVGKSTAQLLERAEQGFAGIKVDPAVKQSALTYLRDWLEHPKFASLLGEQKGDYRPLVEWMIEAGQFDLLLDSFYQVIPFGTGGRRGPVGIGTNRINPYTIASSNQGHVQYLRQRFPGEKELRVVVAYDVRCYGDLRQLYPPDVPNPVSGLSSKNFAHYAAAVYCKAGVAVYMLPDELNDYISTPELSFLIRRYGAHGGLNVSASHNHPDDNGGKFYNDKGGQEVPPYDEQMVKIVETITDIDSMTYGEARKTGLIRMISAEDRDAYIALNLSLRLGQEPRGAKIVFSPLHGTGINTVGRCLTAMGFEEGKTFFAVEAQREFRGDFANVKFRSPNPEVPESLDLAIETGKEVGADLVLATDPDADRIGGAIPHNGDFVFVTGNELAVLVTRYRLESLKKAGKLPAKGVVLETQVTTQLMALIARSFGAQVIDNLLVGFKYIGDIIDRLERDGSFDGVAAGLNDFIIGAEESHGVLLTPQIRDKDAAGAAVVMAELVSELREGGKTIHDYLIDTYKRYGYYRNYLRSTVMQGAAGTAAIRHIQQEMRTHPPKSVGGLKVLSVIDYWDENQFGKFKSETDRASRNQLTFKFEGGLRTTVRPSGTEPKNKVYIEKPSEPLGACASDEEFLEVRRRVDEEVLQFSNAFMKEMLLLVDVELPDYALEISDLVALERKKHFGEKFLPEFESRAKAVMASEATAESTGKWIDEQLRSYGPDARLLVTRAFRAYVAGRRAKGQKQDTQLAVQEEIFFGKSA